MEAGDPKTVVATNLPEKLGTDLIMMGSTGLNALQRTLLGSVADYVVRIAPVDVLLVRTKMDNFTIAKEV